MYAKHAKNSLVSPLKMRVAVLTVLLSLAVLLAACGADQSTQPTQAGQGASASDAALDVGQKAPAFTAQLVDGQSISLDSLRGKVVLINFWATWCGPCRSEMPFFQSLTDQFDKKDFSILAVNFLEKPDAITKFSGQLGLKFDIALDPKGDINRQYGVNQYPVSYVIGRNGVILARQAGPFAPDKLQAALKKWIAGNAS